MQIRVRCTKMVKIQISPASTIFAVAIGGGITYWLWPRIGNPIVTRETATGIAVGVNVIANNVNFNE